MNIKITNKFITLCMVSTFTPGRVVAQSQDQDILSCSTTVLSECYQLPTFTPAKMPRLNGVMYFDYGYRAKQQILISCPSTGGGELQTKEYTRLENLVQPFRMSELGHEDIDLIRNIQIFITHKKTFACE